MIPVARSPEHRKPLSPPGSPVLRRDYGQQNRDNVPIRQGSGSSFPGRSMRSSRRRPSYGGDSVPDTQKLKRSFTLTTMGIKRDNTIDGLSSLPQPTKMQGLKSVLAASRTPVFNTSRRSCRANIMSRIQHIPGFCSNFCEFLRIVHSNPSPHIYVLLFSGRSTILYITRVQETKLSFSSVRQTRARVWQIVMYLLFSLFLCYHLSGEPPGVGSR